jgi:hypothetical protein
MIPGLRAGAAQRARSLGLSKRSIPHKESLAYFLILCNNLFVVSGRRSYLASAHQLRRLKKRESLLCKKRQMFNQTADIAGSQK